MGVYSIGQMPTRDFPKRAHRPPWQGALGRLGAVLQHGVLKFLEFEYLIRYSVVRLPKKSDGSFGIPVSQCQEAVLGTE